MVFQAGTIQYHSVNHGKHNQVDQQIKHRGKLSEIKSSPTEIKRCKISENNIQNANENIFLLKNKKEINLLVVKKEI